MDSLAVFQFDSQEIRFVDGKPVANDVATVLGFKNPADAVFRLVKDKNKGVCKTQTPGGMQSVTVLEEAGIYQLIFSSKLPSAEKFQDWVFEEVLPAIRKSGSYPGVTPMQPEMQQISTAIDLVFACTAIDSRLIAGVKANQIAKSYPALASAMEESKTLLSIPVEKELVRPTQLAELYAQKTGLEISARKMNLLLMEKGMQTKNTSGSSPLWLPTEEGKEYSQIVLDTAKGHNKTVQSLQWYPSVVDVI